MRLYIAVPFGVRRGILPAKISSSRPMIGIGMAASPQRCETATTVRNTPTTSTTSPMPRHNHRT